MNTTVMTEYYNKVYDESVRALTKDDEEYTRLLEVFNSAEDDLKILLDKTGNKLLYRKYEEVIDAYFDVERRLLLDAYLAGARDREKMLE